MTYEKEQKSRVVVFDIETVSETDDPQGCFDAMTGRIVSIALLIDNGYELRPVVICDGDERKILMGFWATIGRDDLLVGHNLLDFDIKFIRQRSWILNVAPSINVNLRKYYTEDVFDVMQVWTNWGYKMKGCGLDNIAKALGLGGKTGHGSEVAGLWANKQYKQLMDYNLADTLVTYQCYCRMTYRAPLALPVAEGVALPTFLPGDVREPVFALTQQKGPETVSAAQAPLYVEPSQATVPPVSTKVDPPRRRNSRSRPKEIKYAEMGGALILGGSTFPVKDSLSDMGGRWDGKVWQLPAAKLGALQAACANNGIRLISANGGS